MKKWGVKNLNVDLFKKQWVLYNAFIDDRITEILYGWWGRCGKTRWVSEIVNMTCIQYPWIARLIGRDTLKKLKATTFLTFQKVLQSHWIKKGTHYDINMTDMSLQYYNGSRIFFVDLWWKPSDPFYDRFGWFDLTFYRVDEAQEVMRLAIDTLAGRLSEKLIEHNLTGKWILTCNPKKWHLYFDFIKTKSGKIKDHRIFIPASYKDNPHIDQKKYHDSIMNTWNKIQIERLLHGNREYDDTPWKLYSYDAINDLYTNRQVWEDGYLVFDPARMWEDRAVASRRVWLRLVQRYVYETCTLDFFQEEMRSIAHRHGIPMSRVLWDADWLGAWVVDWLQCEWFNNNWSPIQTEHQQEMWIKQNYQNLKTQCAFKLSEIIEDVSIEDDQYKDMVIEELDVICEIDIDGEKRKIIKKANIKDLIGRSPNFFDNLMMRMKFQLEDKIPDYIPETMFLD